MIIFVKEAGDVNCYSWRFVEPDKIPTGAMTAPESASLKRNLTNWYRAANWRARDEGDRELLAYIAERGPKEGRTIVVREPFSGPEKLMKFARNLEKARE